MTPVYKSINRPLTVLGIDRRLFFVSMTIGFAAWDVLNTVLGGVLLFAILFTLARRATHTDPELLRILINSSRYKTHYDAAKRETYEVVHFGKALHTS